MSFTLAPGRIGCLLGPSGCGKTTMLRCLAGFEPVEGGEIMLADRVVSKPGFQLPPEKRGIGMVFQDYALFPHLSVARNIGFGLTRMARPEAAKGNDPILYSRPRSLHCSSVRPTEAISGEVKITAGTQRAS